MTTKFYKSQAQMLLIMFAGIMCIFSAHGQTIRIADNNVNRPAGANVFSTLQAAIDAAQPGDIVYITPSVTSYGNVRLGKRITLTGVGFKADVGDRASEVGSLVISSSSDGVNGISGAILKNFSVSILAFDGTGIGTPIFENIIMEHIKVVSFTTIGYSANRLIDNLTIRDSEFGGIALGSLSAGMTNSIFYNNVIGSLMISGTGIMNNTFANNIIMNDFPLSVRATDGAVNNTLFLNNVLSGAGDLFGELEGVTFNNNIFYGVTPAPANLASHFRNNVFSYNLVTGTATMPPPGTSGGTNSGIGNLTGVSPNFFAVSSTTWNESFDYSLNAGSPAISAGSDGTDIGITGGTYPIDKNISFTPSPMPLITELNTSGVIPQDQPLKTSIKATSY